MKRFLLLFLIYSLSNNFINAQTNPLPPTDVFTTRMTITGKTQEATTIFIYFENILKPVEVKPDNSGKFEYKFEPVLKGDEKITISSKDENDKESTPKPVKIYTDKEVKDLLASSTKKLQTDTKLANESIIFLEKENKKIEEQIKKDEEIKLKKQITDLEAKGYSVEKKEKEITLEDVNAGINELNLEKKALVNSTLLYKTTIWSTNFNIPLVRFNFVEDDDTKQGDILLFTSIGAGIGHYWGRLERTRDNEGEIINEEFSNTFGLSLGALFSAGTGEDTKNVFAPVFNISALDFQLGVGVELGTLNPSQKREFITLSYSIPLYKLFKRSYRLRRSNQIPIESTRKTQG